MAKFFWAICLFSLELAYGADPSDISRFISILYNSSSDNYIVVEGMKGDAVASANFTDVTKSSGWAYLTISTNGAHNDSMQAYAAGFAEGFITSPFIYNHWMNTINNYCQDTFNPSDYCIRLRNFLTTNLKWMNKQIEQNPDDPYWHQVYLILQQLAGLEDGYTNKPLYTSPQTLNPFGFLLFQIFGDLDEIQIALNQTSGGRKATLGQGSCSALIKLLPNNQDLYVSHVTWNTYNSMLRIIKKYTFNYQAQPSSRHTPSSSFKPSSSSSSKVIPGQSMAFSSYPGVLYSGDDFNIIGNGLVTLETTIGNQNDSLWSYIKPEGQVLECFRCTVANRLATSGSQWTDLFRKFNSGTYNNQWMIVDYNVFKPGQPLPSSQLLTVLEQAPGLIVAKDLTSVLAEQKYWPSYNTPYFQEIFKMSGREAMVAEYGDWWTYEKTPRALIFKRDHVKVQDLTSMTKLMRYNDFKNDALSRCNCTPPYSAENAISARSDLNPADGKYPFFALGFRSHGGTDMKVTSSGMYKNLEMVAVSGPSSDDQPVFQWSTSPFTDVIHYGHPDTFDFDPVLVSWNSKEKNVFYNKL